MRMSNDVFDRQIDRMIYAIQLSFMFFWISFSVDTYGMSDLQVSLTNVDNLANL